MEYNLNSINLREDDEIHVWFSELLNKKVSGVNSGETCFDIIAEFIPPVSDNTKQLVLMEKMCVAP
jgi:hypothetical protein